MTDDAEPCPSCLRSPARHPSRSGGGLGLELDLDLPPAAPAPRAKQVDPARAPLPPLPGPQASSRPVKGTVIGVAPPAPAAAAPRRATVLGVAPRAAPPPAPAIAATPRPEPPASGSSKMVDELALALDAALAAAPARPSEPAPALPERPASRPSSGAEAPAPVLDGPGLAVDLDLDAAPADEASEGDDPFGSDIMGAAGGAAAEEGTGLEDLELDLPDQPAPRPKAKAKPRRRAPKAAPEATPDGSTGADFDALDDPWGDGAGGGLDIALAMDSVRPPAALDTAKPKVGPAAHAGGTGKQGRTGPEPASAPGGPVEPAIDMFEVRMLADYGGEPKNLLQAVQYAWRVYRRRAELRELCQGRGRAHDETRRRIQEQFAGLVEELWVKIDPGDADLVTILQPVEEAKRLIADRSAQLAATKEQFAAQHARVERELAELARLRQDLEARRSQALIALEDRSQAEARADAQHKRLERDLQAAHEAARAAAGADAEFAPPEHAKRIGELEDELGRAAELRRAAERSLSEARGVVADHDRALREHDRRVGGVKDQGSHLGKQAEEAHDLRIEGIRQAEQKKLDCYEQALRAIATTHPGRLDAGKSERFAKLEAELLASLAELDKHRLAVDAYDQAAYQRGLFVAGAVVAVAVLAFLVLAINVGR